MLGLLAATVLAGCDQGQQDNQTITVGPPIALVTGAGSLTNIGPSQPLPVDLPIVLQFNRLLNPNSVTRQSIQLLTSSQALLTEPVVDYDPVLMTVTLSNPGAGFMWLTEGSSYEIQFPVPTSASDIDGLRAIDDATFASPTTVAFEVGAASGAGTPEPTMHFCVDILPIFTGKCALSGCHASPSAASSADAGPSLPGAGLVLDNSEGVALTAIGRVAQGSNTGASAVPESPGAIFGVDMPIIDPGTAGTGDPANSWLLYKVLLAVPSTPSTTGSSALQCNPFQTADEYAQGSTSPAAMTTERGILANFILGREMPYPAMLNYTESDAGPPSASNLTVQELERLRLWIQQGAPIETVTDADGGTSTNCSRCAQIPAAAGPGAGPSDAGTAG